MKKITALVFLVLISLHTSAQQNSATTNGSCNVVITGGNGNNVKVDCPNRGTTTGGNGGNNTNVNLVIGSAKGSMVIGSIYWPFVDLSLSEFSVSIDDMKIVSEYMDSLFQDTTLSLSPGQHFYRIDVELWYRNQNSGDASCAGVIDVRQPARIIPRISLSQDSSDGSLAPISCGFFLY